MKKLLLTFDYELFLGPISGSIEKCLIIPTDCILDVLKRSEFKALFFVDALYLSRLKQIDTGKAKSDFSQICSQLDRIIQEGHSVGIHIHPHWIDAQFNVEKNNWDGSEKRNFALSCLGEQDLEGVISESFFVLRPWLDTNRPLSFRAGGFYAQPFIRYRNILKSYNVLWDFSVMREFQSSGLNDIYSFNYSKPPSSFIYRFESDLLIEEDGSFVEVSVNPFVLSGFRRVMNSVYYRWSQSREDQQRIGDGLGSGNVISPIFSHPLFRYFTLKQSYSVELMNPLVSRFYLKDLSNLGYVHFVSHPKLMSKFSLDSFVYFCEKARRISNLETSIEHIVNHSLS